MITDTNQRPRVNALAPHIVSAQSSEHKSSTMRKSQQQRPSLMAALHDKSHHKATNFVAQNKNSIGGVSKPAHRKDYGVGKLPSLGLSKYVAHDFEDDTRNPFKVQSNTEKMLVMRELEREYGELNKHHKDTLAVYEKQIETRVDRAGALRRIDEIPPAKRDKAKKRKPGMQEFADEDTQQRQKLNIFDAQDSTVLKHETLARIGLDEHQVAVYDDNQSEVSRSSHSSVKLAPIDYLNKTRQQKETVRDFIQNSRAILMA